MIEAHSCWHSCPTPSDIQFSSHWMLLLYPLMYCWNKSIQPTFPSVKSSLDIPLQCWALLHSYGAGLCKNSVLWSVWYEITTMYCDYALIRCIVYWLMLHLINFLLVFICWSEMLHQTIKYPMISKHLVVQAICFWNKISVFVHLLCYIPLCWINPVYSNWNFLDNTLVSWCVPARISISPQQVTEIDLIASTLLLEVNYNLLGLFWLVNPTR